MAIWYNVLVFWILVFLFLLCWLNSLKLSVSCSCECSYPDAILICMYLIALNVSSYNLDVFYSSLLLFSLYILNIVLLFLLMSWFVYCCCDMLIVWMLFFLLWLFVCFYLNGLVCFYVIDVFNCCVSKIYFDLVCVLICFGLRFLLC